MRTPFENLKDGSKFKPFDTSDRGDYTKVDDFHYSYNYGKPLSIDSKQLVYPVQPDSLKDPEKQELWSSNLDFMGVCKLFLIAYLVIWFLSAIFSSGSNNASQDATLKSAEQKIDKGNTDSLTDQEKKDVDKIWNNK